MEVFQKSFSILDDVAVIRSSVLADCGVNDRQDTTSVTLPNYEPIITKMRIGIRKSGYLASPYEGENSKSMSGQKLNPVIMDIYKHWVSARDTDIRNVIRYGTVKKAYNFERGFQGNFRRKES